MSGEKFTIEVNESFLQNLFGLADMMPPENVGIDDLNNVVKAIKKKIDNSILSQSSLAPASSEAPLESAPFQGIAPAPAVATSTESLADSAANEFLRGGEVEEGVVRPKSVLIVDDLGIITYQLETLFKKIGFDTTVSRELYDAIDKYKKKDFGYVILDLFIPTEREGFMLVDEIKKLALFCKLNTKIIMMSASAKPEYKDKCLSRGADCYVEKTTGWQKTIVEACLS